MSISLTEHVIALADVPGILPKRRGGRKVHTSTVWRWVVKGYRGIRLETIQVGGTRCTSREALERFFEQIDADAVPGSEPTPEGPDRAREIRDAVARAETLLGSGSKRRARSADAVGAVSVPSRAQRGTRP